MQLKRCVGTMDVAFMVLVSVQISYSKLFGFLFKCKLKEVVCL